MYTYQQTQTSTDPCGILFTTGRHDNGRWLPESDWGTEEEARDRAEALNAARRASAMEFPRTYERIRRESQEEYHELMRKRISEIQADFAARLPRG